MIHELKTHAPYFQAILEGRKTHEVRANDRKFVVGDILYLREFYPPEVTGKREGTYSGRDCNVVVSYVTPGGAWGLPDTMCVMSIQRQATEEEVGTWLKRSSSHFKFGDLVELPGHRGHIVDAINIASGSEVSIKCSCGKWIGRSPWATEFAPLPEHYEGCRTPNGRFDSHGKYVQSVSGVWICAFCTTPIQLPPVTMSLPKKTKRRSKKS